jgi:DNA-binding MarR family transcriptional regulator/N-acetylglutamate synthase-like GNAT family acetyltransferase
MEEALISQVRRFNRIVTQRVGALNDRFLARDRPLGEARLLWEIGADGRDVRSLRAQLELDSGYLSRLLRSLEAAGLVTVGPAASDKRVRIARLTSSGSAERAVLDQRSDEMAASLLAPLSARQRDQLVAAMADVERFLTAAMVEVAPTDPAHPHARYCVQAYFSELDRRFETGFDPALSIPADDEELRPPAGLLVVALLRGDPVGCGALKFHNHEPADLKRMWVAESARGLGVGRRLLSELEDHAADHGARAVRLETNKTLVEAISLYRSAGYIEVAPFNDEAYAHHWFEKQIRARASWRRPERVKPEMSE